MPVDILSNNLSDYITVFKNTVKEEDRKKLLEDVKSVKEKFAPARVGGQNDTAVQAKEIRDTDEMSISHQHSPLHHWDDYLFNLFGKYADYYIRENYKEFFTVFASGYKDQGYIALKYDKGQKYEYHPDWSCSGDNSKRFMSALLYLNDEYDGGELEFAFGKKIKPVAGDLIFFPSFPMYMHRSLPITNGTKYSLVSWFITIE